MSHGLYATAFVHSSKIDLYYSSENQDRVSGLSKPESDLTKAEKFVHDFANFKHCKETSDPQCQNFKQQHARSKGSHGQKVSLIKSGNETSRANQEVRLLCKEGQLKDALEVWNILEQHNTKIFPDTYVSLLHICTSTEFLTHGRRIHAHIIKNGTKHDPLLGNCLINMYSNFSCLFDAHLVLNFSKKQNVFLWTSLIGGYVKYGYSLEALGIFMKMQQAGVEPDRVTFVFLLTACINMSSLEHGKSIHNQIRRYGYESDNIVQSSLVNMYAKCGSIEDACHIFDNMCTKNVVIWNAMISGCSQERSLNLSFNLFDQMQAKGIKADKITFLSVLNGAANRAALEQGKRIHSFIIKYKYASDVFLANKLVDMYAKCGSIEHAHHIFDRIAAPTVVSWTGVIAGYVQHDSNSEALGLFAEMRNHKQKPNKVTFVSVLKACANFPAIEWGKLIHANIAKLDCRFDIAVGSTLIDMYVKCGSLCDAQHVFDRILVRNVVSWNVIIFGHAQLSYRKEALRLFQEMKREGVEADDVTFLAILGACADTTDMNGGKFIHSCIISMQCSIKSFLGSALLDMYVKCGSINDACTLFYCMEIQDLASWNTMISAYASEDGEYAFKLLSQMQEDGIWRTSEVILTCLVTASSSMRSLAHGKWAHASMLRAGCELDVFASNLLVDMYANCGTKIDIWHVYEGISVANEITFLSLLDVCSSISDLQLGKIIHTHIREHGLEDNTFIGSALVNMYAKSGSIKDAYWVFNRMSERDLISWTAIITACARHGDGIGAFNIFGRMWAEGFTPDETTIISVLSACNHGGLMDESLHYFSMSKDCGITPSEKHYICIIDICCRAGLLDIAKEVVFNMPFQPSAAFWTDYLSSYSLFDQKTSEETSPRSFLILFSSELLSCV